MDSNSTENSTSGSDFGYNFIQPVCQPMTPELIKIEVEQKNYEAWLYGLVQDCLLSLFHLTPVVHVCIYGALMKEVRESWEWFSWKTQIYWFTIVTGMSLEEGFVASERRKSCENTTIAKHIVDNGTSNSRIGNKSVYSNESKHTQSTVLNGEQKLSCWCKFRRSLVSLPHLQPKYARSRRNSILVDKNQASQDYNYTVNTQFTASNVHEHKIEKSIEKFKNSNSNSNNSKGVRSGVLNTADSQNLTENLSNRVSTQPPIFDPEESNLEVVAKSRPCLNRHPTDTTVLCHSIGSIASVSMSPVIGRNEQLQFLNESLNDDTAPNSNNSNAFNGTVYQSTST